MDFLFSTDPGAFARLSALIPDHAYAANGPWGSFVATGSRYLGLDPVIADDGICVVVADPLGNPPIDPDTPPSPQRRTLAYMAAARVGALPKPEHPGAVLVIPFEGFVHPGGLSGRAFGITDASGFGAVYYRRAPSGDFVLSSSPDLIAGVHPAEFDRVSALELLANNYVSVPATLYRGVEALRSGARFRFAEGRLFQKKWWMPPARKSDMTLDEAIVEMEGGFQRLAFLLRSQVSDTGWVTLSAGMDSRYLAVMLSRRLTLKSVGIGVKGSPNLWVASEVARALGLEHRASFRQEDHYAALALNLPRSLPSHYKCLDHHYSGQSMGEGIGPFLVGANRAENVLTRFDPSLEAWRVANPKCIAPPGYPDWAFDPIVARFDRKDVDLIDARHLAWAEELAIDRDDAEPGIFPLMWERSKSAGHFVSASRNYPLYEVFHTRALCDFHWRCPANSLTSAALPDEERKRAYYGRRLKRLDKIPINPTDTAEYRSMLDAIRKALPRPLWPIDLMEAGEWTQRKGPFTEEVKARGAEARALMAKVLGVEIVYSDWRDYHCIQLMHAWNRSSDATG